MAHIKPLNAELQKIAIEELGEMPSRIPEDLENLKTWIQQQPHLKARKDDQFLVQFLRGCKYNLDEAKEKLDYFYTFKTLCTDFAPIVDSAQFREIYKLGCVTVLPTPINECGPRIVVYRYLYPTDQYSMEEIIQICFATIESLIMTDPYAGICGIVYLLDMAQITQGHFQQYTPLVVKKLALFYEKVIPLRTNSFCFINVPSDANDFFKLYLQSLDEDLRHKVFICDKNISQLTAQIPLKYLPRDYGGENGCLDELVKGYNKVWDEQRDYFKENAQYGTDESLRCGKPLDFNEIFEDDWVVIE